MEPAIYCKHIDARKVRIDIRHRVKLRSMKFPKRCRPPSRQNRFQNGSPESHQPLPSPPFRPIKAGGDPLGSDTVPD